MTVRQTVIDLTGEDDSGTTMIDLTRNSSPPSNNPSRPRTPSAHGGGDTSATNTNNQNQNESNSDQIAHSGEIRGAESTQPNTSSSGRSKALVGNGGNTSTNSPIPKRKRRESLDSLARANNTSQGGGVPPSKRPRAGDATPNMTNQEEITSNATRKNKRRNKTRNKSTTDGKSNDIASVEQSEVEVSSKSRHKSLERGSNDKGKQSGRRSQSPMPQSNGNTSKSKQKSKSRGKTKSKSPSPAPLDLFFVDIEPNKENKHIDEPTKVPYRREFGNLQLPEHVLLDTIEEATMTPGNEIFPPATPGLSDEEIDIIDDRAPNIRRYWEPEAAAPEVEECRTCTHSALHNPKFSYLSPSALHVAQRRIRLDGALSRPRAIDAVILGIYRLIVQCAPTTRPTFVVAICAAPAAMARIPEVREQDVRARLELKSLILGADNPVEQEKFIGLDPWCYACGCLGHLGDDCQTEVNTSGTSSAFGQANVLYGPFAPRYRRVADDIVKQFGGSKHVLFGDQVLDDSSMTNAAPSYEIELPSSKISFRPGESGKRKEQERMSRSKQSHEDAEEDDWFERRHERPIPSRPRANRDSREMRRRSPPRDDRWDSRRREDRGSGRIDLSLKARLDDRSRGFGYESESRKNPLLERLKGSDYERERDSRRERDRDRPQPQNQGRERALSSRLEMDQFSKRSRNEDRGDVIYSTGYPRSRRSRSPHQRPRSPREQPPPLPPAPAPLPSRKLAYPSAQEMAAGYDLPPGRGFSIRGAATRGRAES
ncbi:hypothetical protein FRC17_001964 [Serendipita sp. 399]|nr:hypothetical protein FRC17_001964 [Serendipita sp. 399]